MRRIAVARQHRRQGIARRLVTQCLAALDALGIQKCHLFLFESNTAGKAFWEAMGWTVRADIGVVSKMIAG